MTITITGSLDFNPIIDGMRMRFAQNRLPTVAGGAVTEPGWILWAGTLGLESAVPDRIAPAVACGYSRISVSPLDVARSEEAGTSAVELGRRIRDAGLGIVVARNVFERRREFGLLAAVGFTPRTLRALVFAEHRWLIAGAVGIGAVSALVAVWPRLAAQASEFPWRGIFTLLAGMALLGVTLLKLFFHDLWHLGGLYRIGALIGLRRFIEA